MTSRRIKYRIPSNQDAEKIYHLAAASECVIAMRSEVRDPKLNARLDQTLAGLTRMLLACTKEHITTDESLPDQGTNCH